MLLPLGQLDVGACHVSMIIEVMKYFVLVETSLEEKSPSEVPIPQQAKSRQSVRRKEFQENKTCKKQNTERKIRQEEMRLTWRKCQVDLRIRVKRASITKFVLPEHTELR